MNSFINTEAKLFCMLIIVFLYFYQIKGLKNQCIENKLLYFFSLAEILFSVVLSVIENNYINILCAISSFFAIYFYFKKAPILNKYMSLFICTVSAILTYYSKVYGLNITDYVLTFLIIVTVVLEQDKKIRVDNLTKLYNRYGMDRELKEQLRQYKRENSNSFYIIACDLDNFKHINDTWGHPEGDRALILVAKALSKIGNKYSSSVFRIGGDEFIIITDTSEEDLAVNITNEIKKEFDNIDFRDDFDIKISIGVALYDGVTPIDELLNNADKKLYEAKEKIKCNGRYI